MATPSNADLVPEKWRNQEPNDAFAFYETEFYCILLQTEEFVLDRFVSWPAQKTLFVYAETIRIVESLNLESRKLSLFCNTLKLSQPAIRIKVSGANGEVALANTATTTKGYGQASGNLTLYVEDLRNELIPQRDENDVPHGLYLLAEGGDGGAGAFNTQGGKGGNGGNGGAGGKIDVYFSHRLYTDLAQLDEVMESKTLPWSMKVERFVAFKQNDAISSAAIAKFLEACKTYSDLAKSVTDVQERLQILNIRSAPDEASLRSVKSLLLEQIGAFFKLLQEPTVSKEQHQQITDCYNALEALRQSTAPVKDKPWSDFRTSAVSLTTTLKDLVSHPSDPQSKTSMREAYEKLVKNYKGSISDIIAQLQFTYSTAGGAGGPGGQGSSVEAGHGDAGKNGDKGTTNVEGLYFGEGFDNLDIPEIIANADQCQMLCNRADLDYFTSSPGSGYQKAKTTYETLSRRLSFVPKMMETLNDKKTRPLIDAYLKFEVQKLGFNPIFQLWAIKRRADICLDRIALGLDMLGHPPEWVPRLAYSYYRDIIDTQIEVVRNLEDKLTTYGSDSKPALEATKNDIDNRLSDLDIKMGLIEGPNGLLNSYATQIKSFTPGLKKKRELIKEAISEVEEQVRKHINMDPQMILDALTMIAFAPTGFMGGIQAIGTIGKATSTIKSLDGTAVEKAYVVNRFNTINNELSKLEEGYRTRSNGVVDVDDPGADKLLASKADLDDMLNKFKEKIRTDDLKKELDAYVNLITRRNGAVVTYNAVVETLLQARADKELYSKQQEQYGEAFLQISPTIPAGRYWIRKFINEARFEAIEALTAGARSLRFWALTPLYHFDKLFDGLPTRTMLDKYNAGLVSDFKACISRFSSKIYNQFPSAVDREHGGQGLCHYLSDDEVTAFKNSASSTPGGLHQVLFTIPVVKSTTSSSDSLFSGYWDVRIDQARVWLFGASVQRGKDGIRRLKVGLTHLGAETIVKYDVEDRSFDFQHDTIPLEFSYDPLNIVNFESAAHAKIHTQQRFPGVFRGEKVDIKNDSVAPVGPFGDWRLVANPTYNAGLDLSGVTGISIEFWGSAANFERF